jgi:RHS repeat-associated protein
VDQTQRTSLQIGGAPATTFDYDGTGIGPSGVQPGVAGATPDYFTRTPRGGLVSLHRGNHTYFYITDRLGSVVALTEPGARGFGTVVKNRYRYSPWGEILAQDPTKDFETVPQPFKFAGAEYDASTGLYKMGARYYDPAVGRFTQLDALGDGYRYALNDPVNIVDPSGYCGEPDSSYTTSDGTIHIISHEPCTTFDNPPYDDMLQHTTGLVDPRGGGGGGGASALEHLVEVLDDIHDVVAGIAMAAGHFAHALSRLDDGIPLLIPDSLFDLVNGKSQI